jgi:hypothetical protein
MDAEDEGRANFLDKIKNQILHYRSRISNAEKELLELIKKSIIASNFSSLISFKKLSKVS